MRTTTVLEQVRREVTYEVTTTDVVSGESSRQTKRSTTFEQSVSVSQEVGSSSKDSQAAATSPLMPSLKASRLIEKKVRIRRRRGDSQNMARLKELGGKKLWNPKDRKSVV